MFSINLDVPGAFLILNYHEFGIFVNLLRSPPLKVFEDHPPFWQISSVLVKLSSIGLKFFVNPFLSRVGSQPLEDSCLFFVVLPHRIIISFLLLALYASSLIVGRILDLQLRIWGCNIFLHIVHKVLLIIVISSEKTFVTHLRFRLRVFLFRIVFHKVSKYYIESKITSLCLWVEASQTPSLTLLRLLGITSQSQGMDLVH